MSEWSGEERRAGMREVQDALNEIKIQLAEMKPALSLIDKHNNTLYGNGQEGLMVKVDHIRGIRLDLQKHERLDHWLFALMITLLGATVFKLFIR